MKYLKLFNNQNEYDSFIESQHFVLPNVSHVANDKFVAFHPKPKTNKAGDIAYWNGSKVDTVSREEWNESLGTAIGVVVVPKGFAPDGKARITALNHATNNNAKYMVYSAVKNNSILNDYCVVPITANTDNYANSTNYFGYLPSDSFTGKQSFCDPDTRYSTTSSYIAPSPYLNGEMNPEYCKELTKGNALSDFNGLHNTIQLCNLGDEYVAANTAHNIDEYGLEWYLPGCGELGFLFVRRERINNTLSMFTDDLIVNTQRINYWSSTEYNLDNAYGIISSNAGVDDLSKTNTCLVRPFAIID